MADKDKPLYYRYVRTGKMIPRTRKRGGVDQNYLEAELQKVFYEEEYVKAFSLDRFGLPLHSKIGNYTTVENYLLDFWSPIIGGEAVYTFILLIRHCYGYDEDGNKKDFSFPDLETLAEKWGKTIPTVKKYLDILEENYFIYRFWRSDPSNHHADDSILYKLRTSIPYLSEEQILKLSPRLQTQHDKFIRQIMGKFNETVDIVEKYDFSEDFAKIIESGTPQQPRTLTLEEIDRYNKIREEQLRSKITPADEQTWSWILQSIKKRISAPSFDTWFGKSFCMVEGNDLIIFTPTSFVADWLHANYLSFIKSAYFEIFDTEPDTVQVRIIQDR